jgi:nucleoside 2-deoxyribosyltransferase
MKVCVSSRIIYKDGWNKIREIFESMGIQYSFPREEDFSEKNPEESVDLMKKIIKRYYSCIDESDILYVYAVKGDVSRAVSAEIGYAKAKGKTIISSEEIKELEIRGMIEKVVPVNLIKEFISEVANV